MRSREQRRKKTPITGGKKKLRPIDRRYWIVPCVAASCIYLQSLSFGFVADDYTQIVNNPQVHEIGGGFHMEGTKTSKRFRYPWSVASIAVGGSVMEGFCGTEVANNAPPRTPMLASAMRSPQPHSLVAGATPRRTQGRMRRLVLMAALCLAMATSSAAAQKGASHARPTYLDAFDERPIVTSPDGRFGVTVTGPKKSLEAWLTIDPSEFPDGPIQVWPIEANGEVLWRPDSRAFAFTDNRYANLAYVLVFGTHFYMGEGGAELGIPITDLTPTVRKAFDQRAQKYYAPAEYDTRLFYAKALRWAGNDQLLVGVNAMTVGPASLPNRGMRNWYMGYLVDVPGKMVLRELDGGQVLSEYGIDLQKQN